MRVLTVGGGSGGHVTPVLAVINELSRLDHDLGVLFVCDTAFESQSRGLMQHALVDVEVQTISAGKYRRYHGESLLDTLLDIPTLGKNIVDVFKIAIGFLQSLVLIARFRPAVVFAKGGYVCLPMGVAAKVCRIPLVIHDSDTRPGLTNKVLSRWATAIGTGSPLENYPYNQAISQYVGVPIDPAFRPFSANEQASAKDSIGIIDTNKPVIVVTGGGLGSEAINTAVVQIGQQLIDDGYEVYHVTGKKHYETVTANAPRHAAYHTVPFVYKDMVSVLGSADIVISRASATFIQELAALQKAVILIPARHLGDQVKNAEVYKSSQSALVLTDNDIHNPLKLLEAVRELHPSKTQPAAMAQKLHSFARPDAALDMAGMIVKAVKQQGGGV